jgi:putative transposase
VIPILYLKGLSTSVFQSALSVLFGDGVKGLSPSSIVSLKKSWQKEFDEWRKTRITEEIIYIWADGVNVNIRLGEDNLFAGRGFEPLTFGL